MTQVPTKDDEMIKNNNRSIIKTMNSEINAVAIDRARDGFFQLQRDVTHSVPSIPVRSVASTFVTMLDTASLQARKPCIYRCAHSVQAAVTEVVDTKRLKDVLSRKDSVTNRDRDAIRELCEAFNESLSALDIPTLELFTVAISRVYGVLDKCHV